MNYYFSITINLVASLVSSKTNLLIVCAILVFINLGILIDLIELQIYIYSA